MIEKLLSEMTLREKIGQTGMPGPAEVRKSVTEYGSYTEYLTKLPYGGIYFDKSAVDNDGNKLTSAEQSFNIVKEFNNNLKVPAFVSCDCEYGACGMFDDLHRITSNMSLGASKAKELAYKRSYYWARELRSCGINWAFGPVFDLQSHFLSGSGIRCLSDNPEISVELIPEMIRGVQDAGISACAKHFPGHGRDYRDSHFSSCTNNTTMEEWKEKYEDIWKTAIKSGVDSFMTAHSPFPAVEDELVRGKYPVPVTASKKSLAFLRSLGFDGVVITDAVSMKNIASLYESDEMYINCFNAGNDIVLFCHNDYIDVIEQAVKDGRVSEKRIDDSVRRILKMKQKLGLLDNSISANPLTKEENEEFDNLNYEIAKKAITVVKNDENVIPFNKDKVKNVVILNVCPVEGINEWTDMVNAFKDRGINATVHNWLKSKDELKKLSKENDIIIYACYLAQGQPQGMPFFSRPEDLFTLFCGLSTGTEKSVVVSFGAPSIYYNYFETAGTYLNAYSADKGTINAFVDGILGKFEFTGKSPVALIPDFK